MTNVTDVEDNQRKS